VELVPHITNDFKKASAKLDEPTLLGDASAIRACCPRKQKAGKRDAMHILTLLVEDRFTAVWQPPMENEQLRQLLLHRCRLVRMRMRGSSCSAVARLVAQRLIGRPASSP
jgi:hypothetical protein